MANIQLVRVSMAEYVECRKCLVSVHTHNDGMALHARYHHPRTDPQKMYRPAPDRWVISGDRIDSDKPR